MCLFFLKEKEIKINFVNDIHNSPCVRADSTMLKEPISGGWRICLGWGEDAPPQSDQR